MNTLQLVLSALFVLTIVVLIAPGVLAMNRGKMLRNIALWLAIMLGLALIYTNIKPKTNLAPPQQDKEVSAPAAVPAPMEKGSDEDSDYTPPSGD